MAGLHLVNLHALLALGGEAKLGLGLKPVGLGEGAHDDLAVADGDRVQLLVGHALAGLAAVERVSDRASGGDKQLNDPVPASLE